MRINQWCGRKIHQPKCRRCKTYSHPSSTCWARRYPIAALKQTKLGSLYCRVNRPHRTTFFRMMKVRIWLLYLFSMSWECCNSMSKASSCRPDSLTPEAFCKASRKCKLTIWPTKSETCFWACKSKEFLQMAFLASKVRHYRHPKSMFSRQAMLRRRRGHRPETKSAVITSSLSLGTKKEKY